MATPLYLALDLGTTTLAGRLLAADGTVCAEASRFNPQIPYGSDVLRRLEAALAGDAARLQQLLLEGMANLVADLVQLADATVNQIAGAAAAANPAISCLLQQLPVDKLLYPPHRPPVRDGQTLTVDFLPCSLYLFPLVSGYVGGDLVAVLHGFPACPAGTFFVDVGTNGEMALFNGHQWWVTSVAAGPAFEGGNIACGMPAITGAISDVTLNGDRLQLQVIGGAAAKGLCGSGLVAAIAAARRGGLIDGHGTLCEPDAIDSNLSRYLGHNGAEATLRLYRDASCCVELSQQDIRNFQLAKGAVYAGAECLLRRAGLAAEDVRHVVLTGALGFALRAELLDDVGLLPPPLVAKVRFVAGGVLQGLGRYLTQEDGAERVRQLADQLRPYPLSGTPHFEQTFVAALNFPDD